MQHDYFEGGLYQIGFHIMSCYRLLIFPVGCVRVMKWKEEINIFVE